jgi:hypothetical protein
MIWIVLLGIFGAGFGAGLQRARRQGRGLVGAAIFLPLLVLLPLAGYAAYLRWGPSSTETFDDLAGATMLVLAIGLAIISFLGGLAGAWCRQSLYRP